MIWLTGVSAAPMTAARPTAPVPITAMDVPGSGRSVFHTAPVPVWTLQASGASSSNGRSGSTLTTLRSSAMEWRANDDWPKNRPPSATPPLLIGELPSTRLPPMRFCGIHVVQ